MFSDSGQDINICKMWQLVLAVIARHKRAIWTHLKSGDETRGPMSSLSHDIRSQNGKVLAKNTYKIEDNPGKYGFSSLRPYVLYIRCIVTSDLRGTELRYILEFGGWIFLRGRARPAGLGHSLLLLAQEIRTVMKKCLWIIVSQSKRRRNQRLHDRRLANSIR